jgi:3-hydroxy acid dehydrogenase / malonic semialdehyde reductase
MSKIALITGATAGFGEAISHEFAKNGYNIIITGRRLDRLISLKRKIENKYNNEVTFLNFDVRNLEETKKQIASLSGKWKKIDVLVNNAGLASGMSPIQDGDIDDWDKMIDTNIKGLLYVTRCIAPLMIKNKKGHIINIASIAGKEVYANGNVYCTSKHAVAALTKAMRIDLLPFAIRVTDISPGMADTEFSIVRFHGDSAKAKNVYKGFQPLKAADIADAVYYAASRPAHVNISEIVVMPLAQANAGTVLRKS